MDAENRNAMYNPEFVQRVLAKRQEEARRVAAAKEAAARDVKRVAYLGQQAVKQYRVIDLNIDFGGDVTPQPARTIIWAVSRETGIPYATIVGSSRKREVTDARMLAMYEVRRRRPDMSLPMIGRIFGNRDHTTVLHAIRKIEARRAAEPSHTEEPARCA